MNDYMIWPYVERLPVVKHLTGYDPAPKDKFPKINAWIEVMKTTPGVKATIQEDRLHISFIQSVRDNKPNYDSA